MFRHLTNETEKYVNESSFIANLTYLLKKKELWRLDLNPNHILYMVCFSGFVKHHLI